MLSSKPLTWWQGIKSDNIGLAMLLIPRAGLLPIRSPLGNDSQGHYNLSMVSHQNKSQHFLCHGHCPSGAAENNRPLPLNYFLKTNVLTSRMQQACRLLGGKAVGWASVPAIARSRSGTDSFPTRPALPVTNSS